MPLVALEAAVAGTKHFRSAFDAWWRQTLHTAKSGPLDTVHVDVAGLNAAISDAAAKVPSRDPPPPPPARPSLLAPPCWRVRVLAVHTVLVVQAVPRRCASRALAVFGSGFSCLFRLCSCCLFLLCVLCPVDTASSACFARPRAAVHCTLIPVTVTLPHPPPPSPHPRVFVPPSVPPSPLHLPARWRG